MMHIYYRMIFFHPEFKQAVHITKTKYQHHKLKLWEKNLLHLDTYNSHLYYRNFNSGPYVKYCKF